MRFARLELLKYGRFDNCSFNFPEGSPDLHIIFGPNEAGKSTTMSAISDLLFEFGHAATFDFLHDKQLLRVGAVLSKDGTELACRRKRGRSATLIDNQERPLDEGLLAAFLGGQTRDSFHRMFSLDPVGGMSEGTVDQLFLALRLAALEDAVIGGVCLPFLADDLFINFDDDRAKAGFKVLAEVAMTTQVLFFTHHQHLLPIARIAIVPNVLSECTIPM